MVVFSIVDVINDYFCQKYEKFEFDKIWNQQNCLNWSVSFGVCLIECEFNVEQNCQVIDCVICNDYFNFEGELVFGFFGFLYYYFQSLDVFWLMFDLFGFFC